MNTTNKIKNAFIATFCVILFYVLAVYTIGFGESVNYADFECPVCNSDFVLDYGTDFEGTHNYQCYECKVQFSIDE